MDELRYTIVFGWGINDTLQFTRKYEELPQVLGKRKRKLVWICPYYTKWYSMIKRCYDRKYKEKQPTYKNCTVCEEWKYLSNFIKWVDSQPNRNWMNCDLDKDFLSSGNKHYSPESCVYIPAKVNSFITDGRSKRGSYMLGVNLTENSVNPYRSNCSNPFTKGSGHVGMYPTELEAHKAWQAKKHEYACLLAEQQQDPRVAKALRERYAPDKDWTNR